MKEMLYKTVGLLLLVLFSPILLIVCIGLLLYLPVDYCKYRSSCFFKDTKEKYAVFAAVSPYVRFYNTVKANNLPVEYIGDVNAERENRFFYYKNYLILYDLVPEFYKDQNAWFVLQPDGDETDECVDVEFMIKNEIEEFNKLQSTAVCDKAVVLLERSGMDKADLAHIAEFDFMLVYDKKELVSVLKEFIMSIR